MARLWSSGFEANTLTADVEFTSSSGTPTLQGTTVRTGLVALQINGLTSATAKYIEYQYLASEATSKRFFRFYFRATTLPSAENSISSWNDAAGSGTPSVRVTVDNTGVFRLYDEDGQIAAGGPNSNGTSNAISTGVWYRIEVNIDTTLAGGSQVVEAKIDGTVYATSSTRNIAATNQGFHWNLGGNLNAEAQTQASWFFDDLAINDATGSFQNSYPGSGSIIHLHPNADGDNHGWNVAAAAGTANNYQNVDEATPNDVDFVNTATALVVNATDDYNIDATPADLGSGSTINVVQVGVRFNSSAAVSSDTFVPRIKASSGGTVEDGNALSSATATWNTNALAAPRDYPLTLYDLPGASTTVWTKTDLDAAQIGLRMSVDINQSVSVSKTWLLVDYIPSAGTSVPPWPILGAGHFFGPRFS